MNLEEVDERLRSLGRREAAVQLVSRARARRDRAVTLEWLAGYPPLFAKFGEDELCIGPESGGYALRYRARLWPGDRVIRRGTIEELKEYAREFLRIGGAHGGPTIDDKEFWQRRQTLEFTLEREEDGGGLVSYFGRGYEARIFPVDGAADRAVDRAAHGAVLISPKGSFMIVGFGLAANLSPVAASYGRDFHDAEDITLGYRPFHVRVAGVVQRFIHTPIPCLLGTAKTRLGELYLFVVGVGELALVLEDAATQELKVVASGWPRTLCGMEMLPDQVPVELVAPTKYSCEDVAAAIGRSAALAPIVREGLCFHVAQAQMVTGAETIRLFAWAIVLAHHKGRHAPLVDTTIGIFKWLVRECYFPSMPGERVRREALHWLSDATGLASQARPRSPIWTLHFEYFSTPSEEVVARLARSLGR